MTDLEKVLRGLECCKSRSTCNDECPYYHIMEDPNFGIDDCTSQLAADALTLLKSQQAWIAELEAAQTARVMTLEEVRDADYVWLEVRHWEHDLLDVTIYKGETDRTINFEYGFCQMKQLYGRQWRCWTSRPTDEQRKAVKWDE